MTDRDGEKKASGHGSGEAKDAVEDRERLLALLDGIDDVIYVADADTYELLYANKAARAIWGEDLVGMKCHKGLQDRDEPCPFCSNKFIFGDNLGQTHVWEFQNEVDHRWYRCADKAIQWEDGRMVRFELASDITQIKELEQNLRNREEELGRSNRELEQFAYVASHDLQEPLRMMASFSQIITDRYQDQLDDKALTYFNYIKDGASRMQALIDGLLSLSRVDSAGTELQQVDTAEAVQEALDNLTLAIREAGAEVIVSGLPTVMADQVQLIQLLQNLVGNAIKFRGAAPPRVEISAARDGRFWCFQVQDNGIGIAPRNHGRIFRIFQRLHTREEYTGNGIGLSITRKIVERHGGSIWLESAPGQGTRFLFTLPAVDQVPAGSPGGESAG